MHHNIIESVKDIFAEVLLCPKETLNLNRAYVDLGVDSILAIQIAKLIKLQIGIDILYSDLYNYTSIHELAQHLTQIATAKVSNDLNKPKATTTTLNKVISNAEKVAIVGIAGRFPGASHVHQYWENLLQGKCAIATTSRWKDSRYKGGFVDNIDKFDADFFNISPREAQLMDPQQRLLLEIAWEAFEDAGLSLDQLSHSQCGIFTTSLPGDYKYHLHNTAQLYHNFSFLGNAVSVLSGRIAHFFNLKGIALHIDTACSSSLVAMDLAHKYLQDQSCDIAVVGASCIFSTPELFELARTSNLLSKSGLCHTFDCHADGFVPAETVACLVLRRLSDAQKAQQPIYGIIEGSQVNHDGYTNGLMSPNTNAQKELICNSYKKYNIDPLQIGYVEAHGTGTAIGDPIEVKALRESFEAFDKHYHCFLGSSKTNIGHALVASGLASIIKVLGSFKYEMIPPHLHFHTLNPQINLGNFTINTITEKWLPDKPLAVVSAFGFSGTNAHIILRKPTPRPIGHSAQQHLFLFSAKDQHSLMHLLQAYSLFLQDKEDKDLAAISYSLTCRLTRLEVKFITIAQTVATLIKQINDFLNQPRQAFLPQLTEPLSWETIKAKFATQVAFSNRANYLLNVAHYLQQDAKLDLAFLYDQHYHKVALPPYAFHHKAFWIPTHTLHEKGNNTPSREDVSYEGKDKDTNDQKDLMVYKIKERLATLLNYNIADITDDKSLTHYGVDSIIALQLLEPFALDERNTSIVFNSKNIGNLADYLITCQQNLPIKPLKDSCNLLEFPMQKIIVNGIEWHITSKQQDHILLLLPPLNSLAHIWIQQLRFFLRKNQYSIYIPHYPGHGESLYEPASLAEMAQNIINSFKTIAPHGTNFDLIGWSLGGCLAMQIAYAAPYKVNKMVLVNTAAKFAMDLFTQSITLRAELEAHADYLASLYKENLTSSVAYISAGCPLDILQHYYNQLQQFDMVSHLRTFIPQCLIIYGKNDAVIEQSNIDTLSTIPSSITKTFDHYGHFLPLTAPFEFNKLVYEFLTKEEL